MAAARTEMRKTREILRQKWVLGLSHRQVSRSARVSVGTVSETLSRAQVAGLVEWPAIEALDDAALDLRLYGAVSQDAGRAMPDFAAMHCELRRAGVTLQLLHLEYLEKHPGGYRYSQYCEHYRRWLGRQQRSMRQVHHAGAKCFVDYAGQKPHYVNQATGEIVEVELFVAVLGASNYTYAEATASQRSEDWIASHVRAFEYFGGVTAAVVCDQLKSGVVKACRYDPRVQRTYEELATHCGTVILPARPRKPRDKAKVEVAVQVVERWILARLRNETFLSLAALNRRIAELLAELNDRRPCDLREPRVGAPDGDYVAARASTPGGFVCGRTSAGSRGGPTIGARVALSYTRASVSGTSSGRLSSCASATPVATSHQMTISTW